MTKFILRPGTMLLCLASAYAAPAGRLPDPFGPYETSRPRVVHTSNPKLQGLRVVWTRKNGLRSFCLLFAAILCLVLLELKVRRRAHGKQARLAAALAGALRSGSLEFGGLDPSQAARSLWDERDEPEESGELEEPELMSRMPSRYALLAYDQTLTEAPLNYVSRQIGAGTESAETDLLRGVPLYLLKPPIKRTAFGFGEAPLPPERQLAGVAE